MSLPDPIHHSRRARISSERDTARRPKARPALRGQALRRTVAGAARGTLGALGALALLATSLLPSYATAPTAPAPAASSAFDGATQSLSVPEAAASSTSARDGYLVTRSSSDAGEQYAHLSDTFANNPNSAFRWPFDVGVPISSGFGYRNCSGCSSNHQGLDMNPGAGTPIKAIGEGVVVAAGNNPYDTFGIHAIIQHEWNGQVFTSLYAHMLEGSMPLQVGDVVSAGDLVGQVGNTGQSTGAHLHLGIYLDGTTATDPYAFLKELVGS